VHFYLKSVVKQRLADLETPVSIYLKLRDRFPQTLLFEYVDRNYMEHGYSYICCNQIAGITLSNNQLTKTYPNGDSVTSDVTADMKVADEVNAYVKCFSTDLQDAAFSVNGLFGYFSYDAVRYFEQINILSASKNDRQIPDIRLGIYRYIVVFDHFRNEISIVHFSCDEHETIDTDAIDRFISQKPITTHPFRVNSKEHSNFKDKAFLKVIEQEKQHCYKGDVFQVVLSRKFEIAFSGDEFNVYRELRSINPSQYMFYFDYSDYKLFGSSPEAQLKIKNGKATVHPIAGTSMRTGDAAEDSITAEALKNDKKENAEHTMLVDLARNDLSKNYKHVAIPILKSIQFFSHVIHIVSEVTGECAIEAAHSIKVLADTFPAGTLSGAPKYRAMQLIKQYENSNRGFYGGSLGYIGFDGNFNQAIMIRTFLSKNNKLYYQAGAGIVAASVPERELEEVNNKIAALRKAIQNANSF